MAERAPKGLSETVIQSTRAFWSDCTGDPVSEGDAREAIGGVAALFDLLDEWTRNTEGEEDETTP
jgi:hypothetical protein